MLFGDDDYYYYYIWNGRKEKQCSVTDWSLSSLPTDLSIMMLCCCYLSWWMCVWEDAWMMMMLDDDDDLITHTQCIVCCYAVVVGAAWEERERGWVGGRTAWPLPLSLSPPPPLSPFSLYITLFIWAATLYILYMSYLFVAVVWVCVCPSLSSFI